MHGGLKSRTRVNIHYIESTDVEQHGAHLLKGMDAILVPGGFGERGIEGKIQAARYAREHGVPYLGICLGMQVAIVEFGRHALGLADANSTEFNRATPHPVIALISEWQDQARGAQMRDESCEKGATMRLGAQEVLLGAGTRAREIFGKELIMERLQRLLARWARRADRAAQSPVVHRHAVPPGVHLDAARRASAVHRVHPRGARAAGVPAAAGCGCLKVSLPT